MLKKTLGFRGLLFVMAVAMFPGCATQQTGTVQHNSSGNRFEVVYQPKVQPGTTMDRGAKVVYEALMFLGPYGLVFFNDDHLNNVRGSQIDTITVYDDSVKIVHGNGTTSTLSTFTLSLHDLLASKIVVEYDNQKTMTSCDYLVAIKNRAALKFYELPYAQEVADGLFLLRQRTKDDFEKKLSIFVPIAAQYRSTKTKTRMPEEQRKFVVQADAFRQKKEYHKAIEQYQRAIEVNPVSYPDAYNNLALLSAQVDQFYHAVFYMKHYLLLEPEAKDARSNQDKIYEWEGMLSR